jgi:hypothetical protein
LKRSETADTLVQKRTSRSGRIPLGASPSAVHTFVVLVALIAQPQADGLEKEEARGLSTEAIAAGFVPAICW